MQTLRSAGGRHTSRPVLARAGGPSLLAYAGVILGGLLGATLGYGITDIGCHGHCGSSTAIGAIVGAVIGAGRHRRGSPSSCSGRWPSGAAPKR